jgi:hypothetical protein
MPRYGVLRKSRKKPGPKGQGGKRGYKERLGRARSKEGIAVLPGARNPNY